MLNFAHSKNQMAKSMKNLITIFAAFFLYNAFALAQITGTMTDPRDNKVYKTVKIGEQEWMAENLNFKNPNSWCYNNDEANCSKYGRLYSYVGATQACPPGWLLPGSKDWDKLISEIGEDTSAIELIKGGKTGFNALLAGVRYDYGGFNHLNENAYFWSHVFIEDEPAWVYLIGRTMHHVARIHSFRGNGFSVRCIRK